MNKNLFNLILLIFLSLRLCSAQTGNPILIDTALKYSISKHGYFYEDKHLNLTIDSIVRYKNVRKLTPLTPGKVFSKGYTQSYFWIAFDVENTLDQAVHLMFKEHSSSVNRLQLYKQDESGKIHPLGLTGDHFPFKKRPYQNRSFIYPIILTAQEKATFFLWADKRGQNMYMPMSIGRDINIIQAEIPQHTLFGFYTGVFIFAVIFNLLLFTSVRDRIHLYYALYIFCTLIFILEEEGLAFQWFYPDFPGLQDYMRLIMASLSCGLLIQVMQLFINQNQSNSRLFRFTNLYKRFCWMMSAIPVFMLFKSFILLEKTVFYINNLLALLTVIIIVICVTERIKAGYTLGWYYLTATIMLLFGVFNYVFNTLGITNFNLFKPNGLVVGLTAEIIFLSFALTQRYNFLKKEKEVLLEEKSKHQIELADGIFNAQEDERSRLARDLHDDLGGTLSIIKLNITAFQRKALQLTEAERSFYDQTIGMIEKACIDLRAISHNLMPKNFEHAGLIETLNEHFKSLNHSGKIVFDFIFQVEHPIHSAMEITIYRMVNELINNIIRHSCASMATIQILSFDDRINIMAEDNGIGFNPETDKNGLGLQNIRSRVKYLNGRIQIDSNPNGTTTSIDIPLNS
ncbi:7TM diverse intracellular signaling domain-containing protein [Pedobacter sp. GR22-10]|uniref:sensor histidine kinase n=1 Tax=Pedobacter sp. GR22-10 TaxID=2994472 RepID=UPI002248336F|nr:7TM diverse intracellular signaling domain-containing protein [Pedobacter sp. GR22-10]MCX2432092.1 histidine kinase [Pedobacter sp. GR22-10]